MSTKTLKFENGDITRYYSNSTYDYVTEREKVIQDAKLILTTDVRTSTGLGCGLDQLVGKEMFAPISQFSMFPVAFTFQNNVRIGLTRLRDAQHNFLYDQRTLKELIYDFSPVYIWQSSNDPRSYEWKIDILTEDGKSSFSINGAARI
jgi:hypothetical protein